MTLARVPDVLAAYHRVAALPDNPLLPTGEVSGKAIHRLEAIIRKVPDLSVWLQCFEKLVQLLAHKNHGLHRAQMYRLHRLCHVPHNPKWEGKPFVQLIAEGQFDDWFERKSDVPAPSVPQEPVETHQTPLDTPKRPERPREASGWGSIPSGQRVSKSEPKEIIEAELIALRSLDTSTWEGNPLLEHLLPGHARLIRDREESLRGARSATREEVAEAIAKIKSNMFRTSKKQREGAEKKIAHLEGCLGKLKEAS